MGYLTNINSLTSAEQAAWERVRAADAERKAAIDHLVEVTNRERSKRSTRQRLRLVRSDDKPGAAPLAPR